jgi:transcriptional regulator with XRE-family HTH domain
MSQRSEDPQRQALGAAIRARRKRLGLSRKDLEHETEISYPYLSEIEAGKKNPSNIMLQRIGDALQTSPSELMAAAEQAMAQPSAPARETVSQERMMSPAPMMSPATAAPPPSAKASRITKGFFHRSAAADTDLGSPAEDPLIELLRIAKSLPRHELELLLEVARRFDGGS